MSWALVQSVASNAATQTISGSGMLTATAQFSANTTAGNLIVMCVFEQSRGATTTKSGFTISGGGLTWNTRGSWSNSDNFGSPVWQMTGVFSFVNNAASVSSSSSFTASVTFQSASSRTDVLQFALFEFSGNTTSATYLDGGATNSGSSSIPNSGSLAMTANNELVIGGYVGETTTSGTPTGFSTGPTMSLLNGGVVYLLNAPSTTTITWSSGSQAKWAMGAHTVFPLPAPSFPSKVTLTGGNFQDSEGNPVSDGYLIMSPTNDASISQNGFTLQVCAGIPQKILLDNTANVAAGQSVWGTDLLSPSGTKYYVMLFKQDGTQAWTKVQTQTVTGSTFNVSNWIPN